MAVCFDKEIKFNCKTLWAEYVQNSFFKLSSAVIFVFLVLVFFFFFLAACLVFVAARGLSPVMASGGYLLLRCMGFSLW